MKWGLLDGPERLELEGGRQLRLLSAFEVLQARGEARRLAGEEREMALCANACLLARAVLRGDEPEFRDGEQVLAELTVEEIDRLAGAWARFNRQVNPGAQIDEEQVEYCYSMDQILSCIEKSGLSLIKVVSDFDETPAKDSDERWFFICKENGKQKES